MHSSVYLNKPPQVVSRQSLSGEAYRGFPDTKRKRDPVGTSLFLYNGRVASVLLASLIVLVGYGGPLVAGVLLAGSLISYTMDAMRYKDGSLLTVWGSLVLANLCLGYTTLFLDNDYSIPTAILGIVIHSGVMFLTGLWITLQFTWMQVQYPAVVVAFEKMLLTGCVPVCGGVLFWGLITQNGISGAPYIASFVLCALYALFSRPLHSSFPISPHVVSRAGISKLKTVQDPLDCGISFLFVLMTPLVIYVAAHHRVIWSWTHLWSMVLLASGPLLFMSAVPQGLWWLGTGSTSYTAKRVLVLVSLAGFMAGIEGRIVFHSFGQYIKLAPPFSYISITLGMYGIIAVALLYMSGSMDNHTASILFGPIFMVSTAMGCLVVGVPIWALPAPLICAGGLAMYTESNASRDYTLFVLGGILTGAWFLWHHFWFLDIILDGVPLKTMSALILLSLVPALVIPGLAISGGHGVGVLMILQAFIISYLEEMLHSGDFGELTYNIHPMFPTSLVIGTSILGVFLTKKLYDVHHIDSFISFVLQCIYGSKIWMAVMPQTRMTIPIICYALSSLYPIFFPSEKSLQSDGRRLMKIVATVLFVFLSVTASRFALFDALQNVLERKPPESLVAGVLLLALAVGWFPISIKYCTGTDFPRKSVILIASLGILMILLRPPLPIKGGAECPKLPLALCPRLWDATHNPDHEHDDIAIYGDGIRRREHWPLWLIIISSLFGISSATSKVHQHTIFAPKRLVQGSISALFVGAYMALELFREMRQIQGLIIISCFLVCFLVVFMAVPSRGSHMLSPILGLAWIMCLPLGLFFLSMSDPPPLQQDLVRLHPDIYQGIELDKLRIQTARMYLLCCVACQALILAFSAKLRLSLNKSRTKGLDHFSHDSMYIDKAAEFLGGYISNFPNDGPVGILVGGTFDSQRGIRYLGEACNLVTMYCFSLCVWINSILYENRDVVNLLFLSPILLLLCQDSLLLRSLTEKRRYFPPYFFGTGLLVLFTVRSIFSDLVLLEEGVAAKIQAISLNIALVVVCAPSLFAMMVYLWRQQPPRSLFPVLLGLLGSFGTFVSNIDSARILSGLAGLSSILLVSISHQRKWNEAFAL